MALQPLGHARGDLDLVVNGEFYGYKAIRTRLREMGYRFTTDSDSEIALHLYDEYGLDFVSQLRGEFALVLSDRRSGELIAARDRFGIKPLFYTVVNGEVLFASECKALLALGVPARWDTAGILANFRVCAPTHRCSQTSSKSRQVVLSSQRMVGARSALLGDGLSDECYACARGTQRGRDHQGLPRCARRCGRRTSHRRRRSGVFPSVAASIHLPFWVSRRPGSTGRFARSLSHLKARLTNPPWRNALPPSPDRTMFRFP